MNKDTAIAANSNAVDISLLLKQPFYNLPVETSIGVVFLSYNWNDGKTENIVVNLSKHDGYNTELKPGQSRGVVVNTVMYTGYLTVSKSATEPLGWAVNLNAMSLDRVGQGDVTPAAKSKIKAIALEAAAKWAQDSPQILAIRKVQELRGDAESLDKSIKELIAQAQKKTEQLEAVRSLELEAQRDLLALIQSQGSVAQATQAAT